MPISFQVSRKHKIQDELVNNISKYISIEGDTNNSDSNSFRRLY